MQLSVDFGGSTIDIVRWKNSRFLYDRSFEVSEFPFSGKLEDFFAKSRMRLDNVEKIAVTGGKTKNISPKLKDISVIHVSEIEAMGKGGEFLYQRFCKENRLKPQRKFLVVSMGTGTCMTFLDYGKVTHIGGTGVGGGTFLGLSKALLGVSSIGQLKKMFQKGDRRNVDISVGEIVGGDIGIASEDLTASNLGKLSREINFTKHDVAAGIANLIGQTIAITSSFAAVAKECETIVFTGKLTRIEKILETIRWVTGIYKLRAIVPEYADYVSAIGAGVLAF